MIDLHVPEILIGLHLAGRQLESAELNLVRIDRCRDLVLVQVVSGGDPDRDFDSIAVERGQDWLECLVHRQEISVGAAKGAKRAGFAQLNFPAIIIAGQQRYRLGPGLRRIAESYVNAALRLDDEIH